MSSIALNFQYSQKPRISGAPRPQKCSSDVSSLTCCRVNICEYKHVCQGLAYVRAFF